MQAVAGLAIGYAARRSFRSAGMSPDVPVVMEPSVAVNLADFQLDPVAERFFSQPPGELRDAQDAGIDLAAESPHALGKGLSKTQLHAMRATFAMLAVFAVLLASFLVYSRVIMPVPVELAGERAVDLPQAAEAAPVSSLHGAAAR